MQRASCLLCATFVSVVKQDGMLTTSSESLREKFNLPSGDAARTTERYGQKAMSLFATVA